MEEKFTISIGSDHRGYELKELIKNYLKSEGYNIIDFGTHTKESVDYPDFAVKVATSVKEGKAKYGIAICGSGIGVSIAANKIKGIRAVNATSEIITEMSRKHNNANVICFGADTINFATAKKYLTIFFNTEFEQEERHLRRVEKLNSL
ncbi:MAG: ribose 5-phosphate isomerase B [Ignavibacteria bacterium]|nr:ribose 5-phosphate isomerase B [Ignavibacteria bacterium]